MPQLNYTTTSLRLPDRTRQKIDALIEAGHSNTMAGIIDIAIDRMYQEEVRYGTIMEIPKDDNGSKK